MMAARRLTLSHAATLLALAHLAPQALAQRAPDAGQVLQQMQPVQAAPQGGSAIELALPSNDKPVASGGPTVTLNRVEIRGNTVIATDTLLGVLGDVRGRPFDLAGLRSLTQAVTAHYRASGYPFARALLPAQPLTDGVLQIEVVEGRYGQITVRTDDARLAAQAQRFLAGLQPGAVIDSASLERAILLLDDQPGVQPAPLVRPGQAAGTGDLEVSLTRTARVAGEVGLDNTGNRYTGANRARFNLDVFSPFTLGDQLSLRTLMTERDTWFGSVDYQVPLGANGWRAQAGYSRSAYALGKEFATLDATGTASVGNVGLSYALVRSQRFNAALAGQYLHKQLVDRQGATDSRSDKSSDTLPLTLRFDLRDGLGQGGITFGAVTWTVGKLQLDATSRAMDAATGRTQGRFEKLNADLARIQALPGAWSLYARVSAQWTGDNLDSSEGFGLGGVSGVRAYPSGEAYGDRGWVGQAELRYAAGNLMPYVFHDTGRVTRNARPWSTGDNARTLGGGGIGVRAQAGNWSVDASAAWRTAGGAAKSDGLQRAPMVWVTAGYRF